MTTSNRLASIATRQRSTRIRDAFFAACVTLAAAVSLTTLSTACDAASVSQSSHR